MPLQYEPIYGGKIVKTSDGHLELNNGTYIGQGAAAEVHRISAQKAVKVYKDIAYASEHRDKLTILCEKSPGFYESIIAPRDLVYIHSNGGGEVLCGFTMRLVVDAETLDRYYWNPHVTPEEENDFDQNAANLLYDLSEGLKAIHRSRVVIGDLKPDNILISGGKAYIVDVDSASILPDYLADSYTSEYVDPRLKRDYKTAGPYQFDPESDWWAVGVIAFNMFLGALPWVGRHPRMRNPIERAYHYSVVGLDKEVLVPTGGRMRSIEWLEDKSRLQTYFRGIFSNDPVARYPIDNVLEAYFQRPSSGTRLAYRSKARGSTLLSPEERERYETIFNRIEEKARQSVDTRELARQDFLDYMLGRKK